MQGLRAMGEGRAIIGPHPCTVNRDSGRRARLHPGSMRARRGKAARMGRGPSTRQRPPINIAPAWDNRRMDIEKARFNMVEQQIRTWDVLDRDVLALLFVVKREDFVTAAYRMRAFADLEIPLGAGQKMWTPKLEARVLQELRLRR